MIDLLVLSLGFLIHMWSFPYPFKDLLFDSVVRFVQLAFGVVILAFRSPSSLLITPSALIAGLGVGAACFVFQILYHRGIRFRIAEASGRLLASQLIILGFQIPAEELLYRGVFFTILASIWGPLTALVLSSALSTMIAVVSTRKMLNWLGSSLMGVFSALGYYYTQSIWTCVFIHVLNDLGSVSLNEMRNLFPAPPSPVRQ